MDPLVPFHTMLSHSLRECISKSFRTESIRKCTLTTINTRWEATRRVMAVKIIRLTHIIAIQMHLVAESCTICSSRSRRPVRKRLGTLSYIDNRLHITSHTELRKQTKTSDCTLSCRVRSRQVTKTLFDLTVKGQEWGGGCRHEHCSTSKTELCLVA
jgi:hypothetical protein